MPFSSVYMLPPLESLNKKASLLEAVLSVEFILDGMKYILQKDISSGMQIYILPPTLLSNSSI